MLESGDILSDWRSIYIPNITIETASSLFFPLPGSCFVSCYLKMADGPCSRVSTIRLWLAININLSLLVPPCLFTREPQEWS